MNSRTRRLGGTAIILTLALAGCGAAMNDSGGGSLGTFAEPVKLLLLEAVLLNASLAVFNLLPIPPLDGSKVLYSVLPASAHRGATLVGGTRRPPTRQNPPHEGRRLERTARARRS